MGRGIDIIFVGRVSANAYIVGYLPLLGGLLALLDYWILFASSTVMISYGIVANEVEAQRCY